MCRARQGGILDDGKAATALALDASLSPPFAAFPLFAKPYRAFRLPAERNVAVGSAKVPMPLAPGAPSIPSYQVGPPSKARHNALLAFYCRGDLSGSDTVRIPSQYGMYNPYDQRRSGRSWHVGGAHAHQPAVLTPVGASVRL